MDRKCVCVGRVIAGRPVVERVDTSYLGLFGSIARRGAERAWDMTEGEYRQMCVEARRELFHGEANRA